MQTFFMLGKYSAEAIAGVSSDRTKKASDLVKQAGGEIKSIHALLGASDLAVIAEFPGMAEATRASLGLAKLTGIAFTTSPALAVEEFDKLATGV